VPIKWKQVEFMPKIDTDGNSNLPKDLIETMNATRIGLKAPITTPVGKGYRSINLQIRK
ncbi:MAG: Isocitrate dehydrogenase [NAD] subunit alpha, mitochondrial, partial [Marteilia pararefringens]